jgi:hypothetical protein
MRALVTGITPGSRSGHPTICRCLPCRADKSARERARKAAVKEFGPGIVPAEKAKLHLKLLRRYKVGLRAVSAATDISVNALRAIRSGEKNMIRRKIAERILAVNRYVISDHALVPAVKTWNQINELIEEGYTEQFIAKKIGVNSGIQQLGDKNVLAITAERVDRLYHKCTL